MNPYTFDLASPVVAPKRPPAPLLFAHITLTVESATATLRLIAKPHAPEHVIDLMARCYFVLGVPPCQVYRRGRILTGHQPDRALPQIEARSLAYWLARKVRFAIWSPSFPDIAAACGVANHSTVIGGVQSIERAIRHEPFGRVAARARRALVTLQESLK